MMQLKLDDLKDRKKSLNKKQHELLRFLTDFFNEKETGLSYRKYCYHYSFTNKDEIRIMLVQKGLIERVYGKKDVKYRWIGKVRPNFNTAKLLDAEARDRVREKMSKYKANAPEPQAECNNDKKEEVIKPVPVAKRRRVKAVKTKKISVLWGLFSMEY